MESLGYFPVGFDQVVVAETTPEPKGEVLVCESLFVLAFVCLVMVS